MILIIVIFILLIIWLTILFLVANHKSTHKNVKVLVWIAFGVSVFVGFILISGLIVIHRVSNPPIPPTPEVVYGEFPFRLEYEIGEESFVIEDTLIAEYVRSGAAVLIDPAYRIWNTTYLDGTWIYEERWRMGSTRLKETDEIIIRFHSGHASYFMNDYIYGWIGDRSGRGNFRFWTPVISFEFYDENIEDFALFVADSAEALYEHGILLIDWWYTPPIK